MRNILFFLLSVLFFTSCMPAKMYLNSNTWQNEEAYKVKGRNGIFIKQKLQFGNYTTTSVKRSWTKGNSNKNTFGLGDRTRDDYTNFISIDYIQKNQTFQFSLTDDGGNTSQAYAVTKFKAEDLQVGNNPNSIVNIAIDLFSGISNSSNSFYAQIFIGDKNKPWELLLDNQQWQAKPKSYVGLITLDKNNYYTLKPITQMQNKKGKAANILFGAIGFEILNKKNEPVGAISLINNGMVYFNTTDKDERFLIANFAAALLLQQNIE